MHVSVLADLPGRSIATTGTFTMKLEHFDEIKTCGKSNFKNEFLEMLFLPLKKLLFINEIGASNF